jgi:uncharacterized caspase-like protein
MPGQRHAVVIGVNEYADEKIPKLTGAVNDAKEVYEKLTKFGEFDIPAEHFLLDRDATCQGIRKAISDLLWKTAHNHLALFYFSGHGFQDGHGNGYIAPSNIKYDEPFVCGIRMQELRDTILSAKNKDNIVIILDCCYSGIATEPYKALPDVETPVDQCFSTAKAELEGAGTGWIILASSGKNEKSREKVGCTHTIGDLHPHDHGHFTYHLLEGLDGLATDQADMTGKITLHGLMTHISRQMENDKLPKLSYLGAGIGQADAIIIATASKKRDIDRWLEQAEQNLAKGDPWALFDAIDDLGKVLKNWPERPDAMALKSRIDEKLRQYEQSVSLWLRNHKRELRREVPQQFQSLEELAYGMGFNELVKLSADKSTLLLDLCRVSLGECEMKILLGELSSISLSQASRSVAEPERPLKIS